MRKKILNKIKDKCCKFDLVAEEINYNTMKVYSTKYVFDTWLIKIEDNKVCLYHSSKKYNNKKCNYHLQKSYKLKNWYWSIQQINSHNNYVIHRKHYRNTNWVDDILNNYSKRLCIN